MASKIEIDFNELDKLCEIQCAGEEIASWFNIDYDTLNARIMEKFNITFSEYFKLKRGKGKVSLRRKQWQKAITDGDTTMLIFLGKVHLDQDIQKEKIELEKAKLEFEREKFEFTKQQKTPQDADKTESDGFIEALNSSVKEVWADDIPETVEESSI